VPIVFVTGYGEIPTTVQTIKAGAEDFLTKPVLKKRLLEVIERSLFTSMNTEHDSQIVAMRALLSRLRLVNIKSSILGSRQASQCR